MLMVNLATSLSGGAGIGMLRYHQAMLAAGVDSRIIVGDSSAVESPNVAVASQRPISILHRLARRVGVPLDPSVRMVMAVERLDSAAGRRKCYELFSPPFSRCRPEEHPWVQEAGLLNLHWVAGTVDWVSFFRSIELPLIFTLHDQQPYLGGFHYARDLEANPLLGRLEAEVREIKRASLRGRQITVIGNSEWNTREARLSGFFPPETSYHTVYYPLDTLVYTPRPKDAARAAMGIDPARIVIGFACEDLSNRRKGFDILLDALEMLPNSLAARCCLLSFGREASQSVRNRLPMPWIHLGHQQADPVKVAAYSAMDLFVVPSRAEAFGQTAIEAIACHTPVVCSKEGGLSEAIFQGEGGILFETGNPNELSAAVRSLAESQELRTMLMARGRALVVERHDTRQIARQCLQLYKSILA